MKAITLKNAKCNSEHDSWKETRYLLSNPANADHLRRSIAEAQAGNVQERELLHDEEDRGKRLVERLRGRATSKRTTDEIMDLTRGEG